MEKSSLMVATCATLLWAGTALATPDPQQLCDSARIKAWKVYTSCVETVLAKDAKVGPVFDEFKAFWKCRHAYFKKWTTFQPKASLASSTCVGARYTDNGDQTVTDNLSGLMWEKKDDAGGVHDKDNTYTWSTASQGKGNGTAFTTFLTGAGSGLNVAGFAGANDWRLPTLAELQTIMFDFTCTGAGTSATCTCTGPCVDPALDAANTQANLYWSATIFVTNPEFAWYASFNGGYVYFNSLVADTYVRAVRGGL